MAAADGGQDVGWYPLWNVYETERTIRAELAKAKRAEEKKQKEAEKIKAKKKEVTK